MRISDWSSDVCSSDLTVRDWFHEAGNYVDPLDRAAEALAGEIAGTEAVSEAALARRPTTEGISIADSADEEAPMRSRSDEPRVGKESGSTCKSRWQPCH